MKNSILRSTACLAFVLAFLLSAGVSAVYAESKSASCVFVSLEDSAWIAHKDSDVKGTLKVGDVLKEGDKVIVTPGNKVQLAFDKECKNIVQVEGDSSFELRSLSPARISLQKGKIFSILDKLPSGSQFMIETPTAVAAVRGTQYQVNTTGIASNVLVYRGLVEVRGRTPGGNLTDEVLLTAGEKTSVLEAGQAPKNAKRMSDAEIGELDAVSQNIEQTRESIRPEQMDTWIREKASAVSAGDGTEKKSASKSSEKKAPADKGLIVL